MIRGCGDPCCRCHMAETAGGDGWRRGTTQLEEARHGTYSKYVHGCRCAECKAASAKRSRERRAAAKASA